MSAAVKVRILRDVRRRIESGAAAYICFAINDIAEHDHRRNIAQLCKEMQQYFQSRIAPSRSLGEYLEVRGRCPRSADELRKARLKWLDNVISLLQPQD